MFTIMSEGSVKEGRYCAGDRRFIGVSVHLIAFGWIGCLDSRLFAI